MSQSRSDTGAVVLAGGQSRRFGREKAFARWRGQTLLEHVLRAIPAASASIVLVIRAEQDDGRWPIDRILYDDPSLPEGPLRGLVIGLEGSPVPWNWVLATDLPGTRPELLLALREIATQEDLAVVPRWRGRLQPLCALYSQRAAPVLKAMLARGESSVSRALERIPIRILDESRCHRMDPQGLSFLNVNHPDDLRSLESDSTRAPSTARKDGGAR